jgi:hypothetical protein
MPSFTVEVPHSLGQAAAQARLEGFVDTIVEKYKGQVGQVDGSWQDNILSFSLSTYGIKITGRITVLEEKVVLQGDIPFSAMMFKGKITSGIQDALQKALR